jgi:hypothetical protein
MRITSLNISLLVLLVAATFLAPADEPALAADKRDKLQSAIAKDDAKARKKALKAVEKYARWCAEHGAFAEARLYMNVQVLLAGGDFGGKEFDKLYAKDDVPDEEHEAEREAERKKLTDAGADLLNFVIEAWKKNGEDFAAEAAAIWLQFFRDDALLEKAEWGWCAKAGSLMPKSAIAQVEGGELRYAGEWLDAAKIAAHEKKHTTFSDPTTITDGRLTLYSELSLEQSLRAMNTASRFRVFLLARIGGELKLKFPDSPLRIFIAKDRASYNAQGKKLTGIQGVSWSNSYDAGKYLGVVGLRDGPVLLSPDIPTSDTESIPSTEMNWMKLLQHEVTHMISVESLKHAERAASPDYNLWAYEGLATWVENYFWSDESLEFEWVLRRNYPLNVEKGKLAVGRLGHAVAQLDSLPSLDKFVVQTHREFNDGGLDAYAQSCATWVFLYQHGAARRAKLFDYTTKVYCKDSGEETFAHVFKGEDLPKLDGEVRAWLKGLEFID